MMMDMFQSMTGESVGEATGEDGDASEGGDEDVSPEAREAISCIEGV